MLPGLENENLMYRLRGVRDGEPEEILLANRLYFANPSSLNDPSEAQPRIVFSRDTFLNTQEIRAMVSRQMPREKFSKRFEMGNRLKNSYSQKRGDIKETLTSWFRDMLAQSSLCCFFQEPGIQHWAHYGLDHRGYCLAFNRAAYFSYKMPQESLLLHSGESISIQSEPITYVDENNFPEIDMDGDWKESPADSWNVFRAALLTKFLAWANENEHRVIRPAIKAGQQDFTPSDLRAVVFGIRTDEHLAARITQIVRERRIAIPIYRARMAEGRFNPIYERVG